MPRIRNKTGSYQILSNPAGDNIVIPGYSDVNVGYEYSQMLKSMEKQGIIEILPEDNHVDVDLEKRILRILIIARSDPAFSIFRSLWAFREYTPHKVKAIIESLDARFLPLTKNTKNYIVLNGKAISYQDVKDFNPDIVH
ncbi:MAG: hypothetical protein DRP55_04545, partial [Spirochaetes bacterium]